MRIFDKALKSYPQNGELRGHCGADSYAIRAKFNADEIARNFKKAAKLKSYIIALPPLKIIALIILK